MQKTTLHDSDFRPEPHPPQKCLPMLLLRATRGRHHSACETVARRQLIEYSRRGTFFFGRPSIV
jgi:hypothetical protein